MEVIHNGKTYQSSAAKLERTFAHFAGYSRKVEIIPPYTVYRFERGKNYHVFLVKK